MFRLLLIDDDEELCAELCQVLEAEGFKVDTAYDGERGLRCLQDKEYHIIILDLKLPRLNGYGVLKKIKANPRKTKVMVLSGRPLGEPLLKEDGVSQDEEEKVLGLADLVINKPFMIENFITKVKVMALSVVEKSQ